MQLPWFPRLPPWLGPKETRNTMRFLWTYQDLPPGSLNITRTCFRALPPLSTSYPLPTLNLSNPRFASLPPSSDPYIIQPFGHMLSWPPGFLDFLLSSGPLLLLSGSSPVSLLSWLVQPGPFQTPLTFLYLVATTKNFNSTMPWSGHVLVFIHPLTPQNDKKNSQSMASVIYKLSITGTGIWLLKSRG